MVISFNNHMTGCFCHTFRLSSNFLQASAIFLLLLSNLGNGCRKKPNLASCNCDSVAILLFHTTATTYSVFTFWSGKTIPISHTFLRGNCVCLLQMSFFAGETRWMHIHRTGKRETARDSRREIIKRMLDLKYFEAKEAFLSSHAIQVGFRGG